jgi:hypothetical protein
MLADLVHQEPIFYITRIRLGFRWESKHINFLATNFSSNAYFSNMQNLQTQLVIFNPDLLSPRHF